TNGRNEVARSRLALQVHSAAWSAQLKFTRVIKRPRPTKPLPGPPRAVLGDRERGGIDDAVAILGLKRRTVENMGGRGELPGAAKLANRWTFDIDQLRGFVRDEVKRQWSENTQRHRPAATGAALRFGAARASKVGSSAGRFTQITQSLRR